MSRLDDQLLHSHHPCRVVEERRGFLLFVPVPSANEADRFEVRLGICYLTVPTPLLEVSVHLDKEFQMPKEHGAYLALG